MRQRPITGQNCTCLTGKCDLGGWRLPYACKHLSWSAGWPLICLICSKGAHENKQKCGWTCLQPAFGRSSLLVCHENDVGMGLANVVLPQHANSVQNNQRINLVDSASSHTLVSKIKPCMSKYKSFTLKLRTAHYISYSLFDSPLLLGSNRSNSRANTCVNTLRSSIY